MLVTEHILWETVNTFSAPPERPKVHALLDSIHASAYCEVVSASDALFDAGIHLHRERPDKQWSLTDCFSFVIMERYNIHRALTHDHHFIQAGFEALLRRDP